MHKDKVTQFNDQIKFPILLYPIVSVTLEEADTIEPYSHSRREEEEDVSGHGLVEQALL